MEKLVNENFIREITPLSDKDCFYIADGIERVYLSDAFA